MADDNLNENTTSGNIVRIGAVLGVIALLMLSGCLGTIKLKEEQQERTPTPDRVVFTHNVPADMNQVVVKVNTNILDDVAEGVHSSTSDGLYLIDLNQEDQYKVYTWGVEGNGTVVISSTTTLIGDGLNCETKNQNMTCILP